MRFFCIQPDIVEEVQTVRYHTKSSSTVVGSSPPTRRGSAATRSQAKSQSQSPTRPPASHGSAVSETGGTRLTRSRTAASARGSSGGKKAMEERKGGVGDERPKTATGAGGGGGGGGNISVLGMGAPPMPVTIPISIPISMPTASGGTEMAFVQSSPPPMIVPTHELEVDPAPPPPPHTPEKERVDKSKTPDTEIRVDSIPTAIAGFTGGGGVATAAGGIPTDSERDGLPTMKQLRRKSRRMSAPLVALGNLITSGTDTDTTTVKRKRVSKVMIGAPEGFKHEGHIGVGMSGTFLSGGPDLPDAWKVEAWRADIERTPSSNAPAPPTVPTSKGPRPISTPAPAHVSDAETTVSNVAGPTSRNVQIRNRHHRSVDGAVQRRLMEDYARSMEGHGGVSGAMTDAPMGSMRSANPSPNRARSGSTGTNGSPHRRSRSGSASHSHGPSPSQFHNGSNSNNGTGSVGRAGGASMGYSSSHPSSSPVVNGSGSGGGGSGGSYGRSYSHGLGHSHALIQPHSPSHSHGHHGPGPGQEYHPVGKGSFTSLASTPTFGSASTGHTNLLTPNTTNTSLSRSLSDKPYFPPPHVHHIHHHHHHHVPNGANSSGGGGGGGGGGGYYPPQQPQPYQLYHSHLQHLAQAHHPYYHNTPPGGGGLAPGPGPGGALHRSSSATAALPPSSTSSSATVASMTSMASSVTAYGGAGGSMNGHVSGGAGNGTTMTTGRKPIPAQRRKPVPQHLPATAEVSPFPTLLMVNGSSGEKEKREKEGKRTMPSFDEGKRERERGREAIAAKGVDLREKSSLPALPPPSPATDVVVAGAGNGNGPLASKKIPKEMVPLLGVLGEDARYVTKSTKARWDGAMADIANALRDPEAQSPL